MNYREYVGPIGLYDLVAAMQFNLLTSLGLRGRHKLLDIGCGSLRAGRLFIPYLERGNYCGIEPEQWLLEEGISKELGHDILRVKAPRFDHGREFDLTVFGETFDYMVAQSIFTHTSQAQIVNCLKNAARCLAPPASSDLPGGMLAATFYLGEEDYGGAEWVYPDCVCYTVEGLQRLARESGMAFQTLAWPHPNRQTWGIFARPDEIGRIADPTGCLAK